RAITTAGRAVLPTIQHRALERVRAVITTIADPRAQCAMKFMNIHDFDISEYGKERIRPAWQEAAQWAQKDPVKRTFAAAGGLDMTDAPAGPSCVRSRGRPSGQTQGALIGLSRLDAGALRAIDRIFAPLSSSFAVETECDLQAGSDAVSMDAQKLSDRAILPLRRQTRNGEPKRERKIPAFTFRSHEYKKISANCLGGCRIEFKPIYEQWQIAMDMTTSAAEL
ncbi:unnamed protein product, partial [Prorocentrum cordatum]